MRKMLTEEQIKCAMDMVVKKKSDAQVLMYDMQNLSTVDHRKADLHEWLKGVTEDGYRIFTERLERR